jgi:maltoporin
VLNTDYATEQQAPTVRGTQNTKWYGIAGYVKYDFLDWFSTAIRAEYFKDPDGARTGIAQTLKEVTLTPQFKIAKDLYIRPEYRHDWSDQNMFDGSTRKTQDTISVGAMYRF